MKNVGLYSLVALVLTASVVLVGVSGTAAVAIVAWLRSGSALSGRRFSSTARKGKVKFCKLEQITQIVLSYGTRYVRKV